MKEKLSAFARATSLRQLRALATTAEQGGISAAASVLGLTPPAVSQQLRLLESALGGVPLLARGAEGLRPTSAGREVLAALSRIEAALADCAAGIDALRGLASGGVSVGAVSTAKYFAPFALAAFQRAHPGIEISVRVGNRQQIVALLEAFDLDIAITGYPPDRLKLERAVIGAHPHVIIAAPDHRLVRRRRIPLERLNAETFLLREPGSGTRDLMRRLFGTAMPPGRNAVELGSNETIKQAVMAGMGIALLSAHTVAAEVNDGRIAVLDVEGLPIVRQWFIVRRQDARVLPAAQALWKHFLNEGGKFLPALAPRLRAGSSTPRGAGRSS
jgi:LysR family transcriptional regulator for metE and metH